jgi:hypothetical protein
MRSLAISFICFIVTLSLSLSLSFFFFFFCFALLRFAASACSPVGRRGLLRSGVGCARVGGSSAAVLAGSDQHTVRVALLFFLIFVAWFFFVLSRACMHAAAFVCTMCSLTMKIVCLRPPDTFISFRPTHPYMFPALWFNFLFFFLSSSSSCSSFFFLPFLLVFFFSFFLSFFFIFALFFFFSFRSACSTVTQGRLTRVVAVLFQSKDYADSKRPAIGDVHAVLSFSCFVWCLFPHHIGVPLPLSHGA